MTWREAIEYLVQQRIPLKQAQEHFIHSYINAAIKAMGRNRTRAAEILGIHPNTITRRIGFKHATSPARCRETCRVEQSGHARGL